MAQLAPVPSTAAPVPPQNLEAEESVLGAMMLSPGAIGTVSEILDAGDFYRESHARIYRAAIALEQRSEPVDAITLADELHERGELDDVGGRVRIHELAALVPASANVSHYAKIVHEMATLRGLVRVGGEISRLGWERPGETPDLVDQAEQLVFELGEAREAPSEAGAPTSRANAQARSISLATMSRVPPAVKLRFSTQRGMLSELRPWPALTGSRQDGHSGGSAASSASRSRARTGVGRRDSRFVSTIGGAWVCIA